MARIESDLRRWLQLDIAGYQFPAGQKDEHDANWLLIDLAVEYDDKRWRVRDPALLTWEVGYLVEWLRHVAAGDQVDGFEALEPNLSFSFVRHDTAIMLTAHFRLEFCPPEVGSDQRFDGESLQYRVSAGAMTQFADVLESDMARFPRRSPRPA